MFELLVTPAVLVLFHLCRELLTERARRATICAVARALNRGGAVLDIRAGGSATIICVPGPELTRPETPDDHPAE